MAASPEHEGFQSQGRVVYVSFKHSLKMYGLGSYADLDPYGVQIITTSSNKFLLPEARCWEPRVLQLPPHVS